MIRLSIIVPFYNVEQYIGQCLRTIYNQGIPEDTYEVICVDDCSPDSSIKIVEQYAHIHSNLIIIRYEHNRKLGGARNAGLDIARGQYIWFVDSDDLIESNVIGELCHIAESENLDVLHFNYEEYPKHIPLSPVSFSEIMTGPEMFFDDRIIWCNLLVTVWRNIYKRAFLLNNHIRFAENVMFEDNDFSIKVYAYAMRVKHVDIHAYNYRINPKSITRVKCTSEHISYWLDLCHRTQVLLNIFSADDKDKRFQPVLSSFIKYHIVHIIESFKSLSKNEKKAAKKMIIKKIDTSMRPFISRKNYIKVKLGIIR